MAADLVFKIAVAGLLVFSTILASMLILGL